MKNSEIVSLIKEAVSGDYIAYSEADRLALELALTSALPYAQVIRQTLGGEARASLAVRVSADPRSEWNHGIFQNSRNAIFSISNGKIETIAGDRSWFGMRKSVVKDMQDAATKILKFDPRKKVGVTAGLTEAAEEGDGETIFKQAAAAAKAQSGYSTFTSAEKRNAIDTQFFKLIKGKKNEKALKAWASKTHGIEESINEGKESTQPISLNEDLGAISQLLVGLGSGAYIVIDAIKNSLGIETAKQVQRDYELQALKDTANKRKGVTPEQKAAAKAALKKYVDTDARWNQVMQTYNKLAK